MSTAELWRRRRVHGLIPGQVCGEVATATAHGNAEPSPPSGIPDTTPLVGMPTLERNIVTTPGAQLARDLEAAFHTASEGAKLALIGRLVLATPGTVSIVRKWISEQHA